MPRAVTSSPIASLGIAPVPRLPDRPTKTRRTVSRTTSPETPHDHPTVGRIKAFAFPPVGIATGGVHGGFETTSQRLADLVAGHEQALTMRGAGGMKLRLFRVRTVVRRRSSVSRLSLSACKAESTLGNSASGKFNECVKLIVGNLHKSRFGDLKFFWL